MPTLYLTPKPACARVYGHVPSAMYIQSSPALPQASYKSDPPPDRDGNPRHLLSAGATPGKKREKRKKNPALLLQPASPPCKRLLGPHVLRCTILHFLARFRLSVTPPTLK